MITSSSNERIKAARRLHRSKYRRQSGLLLIEGVRLVRDAWQAGMRPQPLFVAPALIERNPSAQILADTCAAHGIEIVACSEAVLASLSETVTPQGIAAVVPAPARPVPPEVDFAVVLDRIRDPGNAGTLLRAAEAAGVQHAIFWPNTVDPFNDKALRAGMGAQFRLPITVCADWSAARAALPASAELYVADAGADLAYDAVNWRRAATLIIGGEADGASQEGRRLATAIRIPMLGATESLNAAVAGTAILFEASRQRRGAR